VSLPALEVAVRDSSAQVREAAVTALGAVGGAGALALARDAWSSDSSYQVRAAALSVVGKLGGAGARDVVLAALETPSYRDVIQSAAIAAVAQRPDSGLVAALARQLGAQPLPAIALAVLTARGDPTARAALLASFDDRRAWVRAWALEAVEDQLDPDAAVALLREAAGRVQRPDALAAVQEAIGRLERKGRS
jgi:HEAT repeat protein